MYEQQNNLVQIAKRLESLRQTDERPAREHMH